ncbi:hypothetical protein F5884DRAFT_118714 [Xylogone sp. PMI_703]|nr:hypothetical protein F5884DRAFT_118714 [Xylogone sp. PMI_703]
MGPPIRHRAIPDSFWRSVWDNREGLPAGLPPVAANSPNLRRPWDRLYERLGSVTNPGNFLILRDSVNAGKVALEPFQCPTSPNRIKRFVSNAINGDEESIEQFMSPLRRTVSVFEYLRDPLTGTRIDSTVPGIYQDLQLIKHHTEGAQGLSAHWIEFYPYYTQQISPFARKYVSDQIRHIRPQHQDLASPYHEYVLSELLKIENKIPEMKYKSED